MTHFLDWIFNTNWINALIFFLILNVLIFFVSIVTGSFLVKKFRHNPVCNSPGSISKLEIFLSVSTIILNAAVTLAGWILWKMGYIKLTYEVNYFVVFDVCKLFFTMDLLMYLLHRIAHLKWFYGILHKTHHSFTNCRPITLFALNPLENLSFGLLWLLVLCMYSSSWLAISIYLTLNVLFGVVGHLGVEFIPARWTGRPILKYFTTSTFHSFHHQDIKHNFGFYTTIWDTIFKSLSPVYFTHFGKKLPLQNVVSND